MRANKIWAWIIGFGLVLFAFHNKALTDLTTDAQGITWLFLPALGLMISIIGIAVLLQSNWDKVSLGERKVYIPLLVIATSIAGSGFWQWAYGEVGWQAGLVPMVFGLYLFGVYLVGRMLGKELFMPFIVAVVVGAVGCVVYGLLYPGLQTGGVISATNYDIATGVLAFGSMVAIWKHQWILVLVALVGLFFTGAPEAVFVVGVMAIVVFIRRDWGKRLWIPAGALVLVMALWFGLGYGGTLYAYTGHTIRNDPTVPYPTNPELAGDTALSGRFPVIMRAMQDIKPLGHGYNISDFSVDFVHNVPLVIVQQVGVVAAVAWLFVTIFCLVRTKWKYAFTVVLALCVFDHFIWTQIAPWWWLLVGVATASTMRNDFIFKEE